MKKVKDAMHVSAEWRDPGASLTEIAQLMKAKDIGAVPIGEDDRLVGIVTDRDIALRAVANEIDLGTAIARDVMSREVHYCMEDEEIDEAIELMEEKQIRRLPVVNREKRLVGMLSLGDISQATSQNAAGELLRSVSAHHA